MNTVISLIGDCPGYSCEKFGRDLYHQLKTYNPCSVLPVPLFTDDWRATHKTARKRADRCGRRGYTFGLANGPHADEVFAINTSLEHRQGRRMDAVYWERPSDSAFDPGPCERHCANRWGVYDHSSGKPVLVAYMVLYRSWSLRLISQVLGHGDHLDNEVMWLLFAGVIKAEQPLGGQFVYNRHDSGTDGLRWFKERLGFQPMRVAWSL